MNIFAVIFSLTLCGVLAAPPEPVPASTDVSELAEFIRGNHIFSANVYKQIIKNKKGDFVMSPLSAEVILALTNEGALGETSLELQNGMNLPSKKESTQKALKNFLPKLQTSDKDLKLLSANKIYAADDIKLNPNFHEVASTVYQAGLENVNFGASAQAANTINQWVEEQTNKKIQNLLKEDSINSDTKLVLVNALYFSGKWVNPFEEYATRKDKFYKTKDDVSEVDMMHQTDYFKYYENKKLNTKFLEMPYQGGNVSLIIALPNEIDGLAQMEQNIEQFLEPQPLTYERVDVKMPKFRIETEIDFIPILQELGIKKIFTDEADLTGLTVDGNKRRLAVSTVVQKAFIDVNEDGTEAAAATGVAAVGYSYVEYSEPPKEFHANHPYVYYLRHEGVILFVGKRA